MDQQPTSTRQLSLIFIKQLLRQPTERRQQMRRLHQHIQLNQRPCLAVLLLLPIRCRQQRRLGRLTMHQHNITLPHPHRHSLSQHIATITIAHTVLPCLLQWSARSNQPPPQLNLPRQQPQHTQLQPHLQYRDSCKISNQSLRATVQRLYSSLKRCESSFGNRCPMRKSCRPTSKAC